jgi:hypothetical protein
MLSCAAQLSLCSQVPGQETPLCYAGQKEDRLLHV